MNKLIFLFVLLLLAVAYIFSQDKLLSNNFPIVNKLKAIYVEQMLAVDEAVTKYFKQTKTIEKLQEENKDLVKLQSLYISQKNENENIIHAISAIPSYSEDITLAKVLSYVNLNDFTTVWLDKPKENNSIEGLIDGEFSAGIVINKSGYSQALLNGNEKSNYAVFVGENKAPGITHEHPKKEFILIKYIPIWITINEGDEVVTSGMDNIFFEGLKVGKVVSIKKMADIQEATVLPYSQVYKKKIFHVYSKKDQPSEVPPANSEGIVENSVEEKKEQTIQ